jgi:hypothetical protein
VVLYSLKSSSKLIGLKILRLLMLRESWWYRPRWLNTYPGVIAIRRIKQGDSCSS